MGVGIGLGVDALSLSGGSSPGPAPGPAAPDKVLKTEADDFLMTEGDENIEFEE